MTDAEFEAHVGTVTKTIDTLVAELHAREAKLDPASFDGRLDARRHGEARRKFQQAGLEMRLGMLRALQQPK